MTDTTKRVEEVRCGCGDTFGSVTEYVDHAMTAHSPDKD